MRENAHQEKVESVNRTTSCSLELPASMTQSQAGQVPSRAMSAALEGTLVERREPLAEILCQMSYDNVRLLALAPGGGVAAEIGAGDGLGEGTASGGGA